ncbi:helix-turn-helix transcriptional regulator [Streptomyces sp. NPDC006997]|uniref:helix-turn-helix domain-containing protein n=1 Tax=Streptomyces sp. NPDC006997 TaxID=3155356 RepID=UPI0033DBA986
MPRDLPENDDTWMRARQRAIGARVRAERRRQNLSQEAVFLAAGIDRRTLQLLEAGDGNPTIATLLRVAYVLEVDLADLMG